MNTGQGQDDTSRDQKNENPSTGGTRQVSIANDRLDSRDLFVGTRRITILHGDDAYHLRLTAQNKLILTK
jgi:hemin uptake protein HemP